MSIDLAPDLRGLLEQEYPRFSEGEMQRRRAALCELMKSRGVDHVVFYGAGWRGLSNGG